MAKEEGLGLLQFCNKGEKKWIEKNRKLFEEQIGNFVTFGQRSFYNEVRASEFQKNKLEFLVRAVPERFILIRVELKNILAFITLGINFIQPLNTFQDGPHHTSWKHQRGV